MTVEFPLLSALAIGLLLGLAVLLYVLHKVRQIHIMAFETNAALQAIRTRDFVDLTHQLEALDNLRAELALPSGLPTTRGGAASPDFLLLLARHARQAVPKTLVECGCGTSTVVLARCAQLNGTGHVYALEHDEGWAAICRQNLSRLGLEDWATVVDAPLVEQNLSGEKWTWYSPAKLPSDLSVDLLVVDGPPALAEPTARYPAGPRLFSMCRPSAVIFIDDAARPGEQEVVARWQREFPRLVRTDPPCEKGCVTLTIPPG